MNKVMKAERDRRAAVTEAEGEKRAAFLNLLRTEKNPKFWMQMVKQNFGKLLTKKFKYEKIAIAEGEAEAIEKVFANNTQR